MAIDAAQDLTRTRAEILAEVALLSHQVIVLRRSVGRPRLHHDDRPLLLILIRLPVDEPTLCELRRSLLSACSGG